MTITAPSLFAHSCNLLDALQTGACGEDAVERAATFLRNAETADLPLSGNEKRFIQDSAAEPAHEERLLRSFALLTAALGEVDVQSRSQGPSGASAMEVIDRLIDSRSDGIFISQPEFGFVARSGSFPEDYPPFRTHRGTEVVLHDGLGGTPGLGYVYFRNPRSALRGMIYLRGLGKSFLSKFSPLWQAAGETMIAADASIPMHQARLDLQRRGEFMNMTWRLVDDFLDWMDSDYRTGLAGSSATLLIPEDGKRQEALRDYGELLNIFGCHLTWCPDSALANDTIAGVSPYRVFGSPKSGRRTASPSHFDSALVAELLKLHRARGSLLLDGFAEGTEMLELRLLQDEQRIAGTVVRSPASLQRALADPKCRDFRLILEEKEPPPFWTRLQRRWNGLRTSADLGAICSEFTGVHAFVPIEGTDRINFSTARNLISGGIGLIAGTASLPLMPNNSGSSETLENLLEAGGIEIIPDFAIRGMGALAAVYHSMMTVRRTKEMSLPALSELPPFFASYLRLYSRRDTASMAQGAWRHAVSAGTMRGPKF